MNPVTCLEFEDMDDGGDEEVDSRVENSHCRKKKKGF